MSNAGQSLLLTSVTNYFDKNINKKKHLYEIVNGKSVVSLRVIDWFVTHYTKTCNIIYWVDDKKDVLIETFPATGGNNLRKVHLYLDYRAQLKSYTKLNFDPFRRHNRISFVVGTSPHTVLETTVGQLNFFRWCFHNHIIEYIYNHLTKIEASMAKFFHERKIKCNVDNDDQTSNKETIDINTQYKGRTREKKVKNTRNINTHTDIIAAPCCLHFS